MSGHTEGPWEYVPPGRMGLDGTNMGGIYSSTGNEVCWFGDCTMYSQSAGSPPIAADARLIAAAPELLAALTKFMEGVDDDCGDPLCGECAPFRAARRAIAKASGSGA